MASKLSIDLTDQDELDLAEYGLTDPADIAAAFYAAFMKGNITPAAEHLRKSRIDAKFAELPPSSKDVVLALEAQQEAVKKQLEADKAALIIAEHDKLPPKEETGEVVVVK